MLVLGITYLALLAYSIAAGVELEQDKLMQVMLHVTMVLSAVAIYFFIDGICLEQEDRRIAGAARISAGLFVLPVLAGRGLGLWAISLAPLSERTGPYNFYAEFSFSRNVEMIGWTLLFPLAMLFLAKLFSKRNDSAALVWLSLLISVCSFIAFFTFFTQSAIFFMIGVFGWGFLLLILLVVYLLKLNKKAW